MKIETWGEDTERTEKEKSKKTKQYLRLEKKYKPSIRISISPYILTIVTVVILLAFVLAGTYFIKTLIIDGSIISEAIIEIFGENSSIIDLMWLMAFMIVPLYLIMRLVYGGSRGVY